MAKVLGIGGVFFKAKDPRALREWYGRVLGFDVQRWGGVMFAPLPSGVTVWSPFDQDTSHFSPSAEPIMINFVVEDLDGLLARAAEQGVPTLARDDSDPHGRFAWLMDPQGCKVELWEPAPEGT
jgi:predicted enzyme related to lactoylglutathione lyase